jgi:hypothetical protein
MKRGKAWIATGYDMYYSRMIGGKEKSSFFDSVEQRYYFPYCPTEYVENISCQYKSQNSKRKSKLPNKYRYERANPTKFSFEILVDKDVETEGIQYGFLGHKHSSLGLVSASEFIERLVDMQKNFFGNQDKGNTGLLELGGLTPTPVYGYITNVNIKTMIHDGSLQNEILRATVKIDFTERPKAQTWLSKQGKPLSAFQIKNRDLGGPKEITPEKLNPNRVRDFASNYDAFNFRSTLQER